MCDLDAAYERRLYVPAYNSMEMRKQQQRQQVSIEDSQACWWIAR